MLSFEEQNLWASIKKQFYQDSKLLVENKRHHSTMLLLCSFIDISASFYTGRTQEKGVADSFRKFMEVYMNIFNRLKFGDLLFSDKNKRVSDLIDVIYYCYRNGTTHEGTLPKGIELFEDQDGGHIGGFGAAGWVKLNIYAMFNATLNGVNKYDNDLLLKTDLQKKFSARYEYLERQRFKKEVLGREDKAKT